MKKVISAIFLVFGLGLTLSLTACGGTQADRVKEAEQQADKATEELKEAPPASK